MSSRKGVEDFRYKAEFAAALHRSRLRNAVGQRHIFIYGCLGLVFSILTILSGNLLLLAGAAFFLIGVILAVLNNKRIQRGREFR